MQYEPYENEYALVQEMSEMQLLEYFLKRVFEAEEIWGLKECGSQWFSREVDGQLAQPIWPCKRNAEDAASGDWENLVPVAESLEFFLYQSLNRLVVNEVMIEIMPYSGETGFLIHPQNLFDILDGMIEAGVYTVDD